MTPADAHAAGRALHLAAGFAAAGLGLAVMLAPKFGRYAGWHRHTGRAYAVLIAAASGTGAALALWRGDAYLTVLGVVTLALVALGWRDGRAARRATGARAAGLLRRHLILMGASYVGAWSGFLATNPVFGTGREWQVWLTVFGPTAVGSVFIARAAARLKPRPPVTPAESTGPIQTE